MTRQSKRTAIGHSRHTRPKNRMKRRHVKRYRGQGLG